MNLLKLVRILKAFEKVLDTKGAPDWIKPRMFIDEVEVEYESASIKFQSDPWEGMITPPTFSIIQASGNHIEISTTNLDIQQPIGETAKLYLALG